MIASLLLKPTRPFCLPYRRSLLLLSVMMLLCTSAAASSYQKKLDTLRDSIQTLQRNLTAQEHKKKYAADALKETEQSISHINRKLNLLRNQKQKVDLELKYLQEKHIQIKNDLKTDQGQLNTLLYQQYLGKANNQLRTLLNQQNPNQLARNMYYYRLLSTARSDNISRLHDHLHQLRAITQSTRKKRNEIIAIETEYTTHNKKLAQARSKHKTMLAQLSKEITQQQNEIEKLTKDEQRIAKLVSEINTILSQDQDKNTLYNSQLPAAQNENQRFTSLKGKLNLPVRGKLVGRFGGQRSGRHITWKGLFISSPNGSNVKAIANGRVVFADWLRGFGNLMIIDHAQNYMSLYGNNEALLKQVGDTVQSGESIATVGNSGGNTISGLYFELRHKGKAFDPLTWIKIE